MAAMGVVARNSSLAQVSANAFYGLAIQLAETVKAVTRANGKTIEEFVELLRHGKVIEFRIVGSAIWQATQQVVWALRGI